MQIQTTRSQSFIDMEEQFGAHNYHPLDVVIERAEGVWVYDVDGRKYLDCLAAYSAVNQGHCHPRIMAAMLEQVKRVTLTSRAFRNDQLPELYKLLHDLTGYDMSLPMNSGAEAVETAIKAARKWGYTVKGIPDGQAEIIVCSNNFHGRTTTIVGFSSEDQYRAGFGPFTPGFVMVPYGDLAAFEKAITPNTAGFLFEPIQGEGGVLVPPAGYLKGTRELCQKHQVLWLADEIQTGFGRTGRKFCVEWDGITDPDMLILGKALGGGLYPVSAVASSRAILGVFKPGDHGSTFGGNPLACAIARAAIQVLIDENLVSRSAELGEYFMKGLRAIPSAHVQEVRGRGLLIGVEIKKSSGPARPFCEKLRDLGILCKETHEQVIRFAPPLVISQAEINWMLERVKQVLS
jgi:ornithine--oxo-acid transaminase